MPMLALILLFSSLFGDGSGPTEDALRSQILRTEAPQDTHAALPLQLYHLRQDRVLRLGSQRPADDPGGSPHAALARVQVAQLWERVDGHWRIQRSISITR
ncbi:TPA: hypothetical protein QDZ75_000560 [Stenotrophomonas maltophilia]|jgi:hypothetical protein|uniref:DUF4440 domain-containing protein n=1 Tax=Stenotrophomonas maltophilia TaxID=40324 RepID=A0A2J0UFG2_STEMA|nr:MULTISPECIES: hypothetical protein [Stenotrophomonas]PJL33601.1 hypothetical protein B9Y64_00460 [Stenotrophomonas maltophilia]HDS1136573.1 hypothetical protein [Stenotrophomonas maltophilia]HDS1145245.1 hypothetical protein [Stenotrophomonas maltophilia]HDS1160289.1 hypothetical protein [Stenotrophomonas maltophilia]